MRLGWGRLRYNRRMDPATSLPRAAPWGPGRLRSGLPARGRLAGRRLLIAAAAIADQGFVAGAGFLANVLLARWLPIDAYGAFAMGMSAFLFLGAFHQGALGEPQQVFLVTRFADERAAYVAGLARIHWWVTGSTAALVLAFGLGATALGSTWASTLAGTAAMLPGTLFFWLSRSAAYAAGVGRWAAVGGATYFAGTLSAVVALHVLGALSPANALAGIGASGLAAGLALRAIVRRRLPPATPMPWRRIVGAHRAYAGWAMLSALLSWVCANLHLVILTVAGGLAAAAGMKALDTALTPVMQGFTALAQLAVPALAASFGASPEDDARRVGKLALQWTGLGVLGALVLWIGGERILSVLYGERFGGHAADLRVYALMLPLYAGGAALTVACRALARADLAFRFAVLSTVLLGLGFALGGRYGVGGVVWACVAAQAIALPAQVDAVARALERRARSAPT
jgi:O-antigen/teichoic acid export membrane protein